MKTVTILISIVLFGCSNDEVPMEIVDENMIITKNNAEKNAQRYAKERYPDFKEVLVDSDSTVSSTCRFGDGWASAKIIDGNGQHVSLKCQTNGRGKGSHGCMTKKEFGGKYSLQKSQLVTGTLSLSAGGYGFVNPEDKSTTIFIPPDKTGAAVNGEVVEVSITEQSKKGPVGKIVNILESKLDSLSGQLEIRKGQPWLIPLRVGIPAVELSIESVSPDIKEGDWIRAKLVSRDTQTGKITASLSQALGNANDLNAEIDAIIDEFDLKSEYSNEEEEAASRIRPRKIARRDLTKELVAVWVFGYPHRGQATSQVTFESVWFRTEVRFKQPRRSKVPRKRRDGVQRIRHKRRQRRLLC